MKSLALLAILVPAYIGGCAVDVGNPNPEEDDNKKAQVRFSIATEFDRIGKSFRLGIQGIEIRGADGGEELSTSLKPVVENVDLFLAEGDSDTKVVTEYGEASIGRYKEVILQLDEKRPFTYVDSEGIERSVAFEDNDHRAIYLNEEFLLAAGEKREIVISFDVRNSLFARGDRPDGYHFRPRGSFSPKRRGLKLSGSSQLPGATIACAYLYDPIMPKWLKEVRKIAARPRPKGVGAKRRPSFASAEELVKDESSDCPNAFARAPVTDGKFEFRRLRPGTYDVRVFHAEKGFEDAKVGVRLEPPHRHGP